MKLTPAESSIENKIKLEKSASAEKAEFGTPSKNSMDNRLILGAGLPPASLVESIEQADREVLSEGLGGVNPFSKGSLPVNIYPGDLTESEK